MATTEYSRKQLIDFFKILGSLLTTNASITVIGGTAIILGYKIDRGTTDVDPWGQIVSDIKINWKKAAEQSGVNVKLDTAAAVAQGPYEFEDRLLPIKELQLKNLKVFYPEAHDLVLMKISRGGDIDASDIDAIHKKHKLKERTLLTRYIDEFIGIYIGDFNELNSKYLATIERLFGEETAERHNKQIAKRRS